jgi:hypothetical protein
MDLINSVVHNNTAYFVVGSKLGLSKLLFYQISRVGSTWAVTDNSTFNYEGQTIIDAQFFVDIEAANASVLLVTLQDQNTHEYQLKFSRIAPFADYNYMTWR